MNRSVDQNNPGFSKDSHIFGYDVNRIVEIEENGFFFYEFEHAATGAKHVHISNNDKENTFGVAFKTVPTDSTGVAHILEHTVLCGSKKFSVHDPFFSMLRRSLSTFMNAFTSSDWTMYPFSSQNRKDFYNLMDVYLDSAFYPKIDELSFKQEGHRLEVENDSPTSDSLKLVYKGVVYNEMKGAMSSPSQVMGRSILNALYPQTTYRYNSGGDPAVMPTLTYEQLRAFHRRHYHPSNAFFYTYGNLPLKDHLEFINDTVLKHFERIDPQTKVPLQPRLSMPKKATYQYPLGKNEDPSKKCQVCVAWLTADIKNAFEVLTLVLLGQILLGNSGSPLRKALIESKLGTALCDGTGFDSDNRDTMFVCGLKDVEESAADQIETIVLEVLKDLSANGIDKQLIESAIHQLEFHRKEVTNTPYPYGIKLLLAFAGTWFHGGDPLKILQFDSDVARLRREIAKGPFFEGRIQKYLLDNPHRVLLTLVPDQQKETRERDRVDAELQRIRAEIKPADLEKIINDAKALKQLQEDKEDVSCLPTLALEEIPPTVQSIQASAVDETLRLAGYRQPTSGIFYFSAVAGSGFLPEHLIPLVPFFCHAFPKIGTSVRDYSEMAQLIDAYTGGIGLSCQARTSFDAAGDCLPLAAFNAKCLVRNQDKMFEIIAELLNKIDFSDLVRLKSLFLEYRASLESMVVHNGHRLAMSLASRNFSLTQALNETWHGIHQLKTIKDITADLTEHRLQSIAQELAMIGKFLFTKDNLKVALIGEDRAVSAATSSAASIQTGLSGKPEHGKSTHGFILPKIAIEKEIPREGWSTSTAVSFVARAFPTVRMDHKDAPALSVISKILRSLYLHREIREKGGAYGGFAIYNREDGLFCFGSYRDPHIVSTLRVYEEVPVFLKSGDFSDEDIKEAILQVCSEIDKPDPPGPAARKAFLRKIVLLSDEMRKQFKEKLLAVNRHQVVSAAEKYFNDDTNHAVAVISSEDSLKTANKELSDKPLKLYKI
ncbi:MAG: insulinase family protein [Desulfobacterales bacterium]|uniref:Insulinase family protein n=1 Tax=Candidatus Desulfatibia profunda TaxID=2841695 RepID=A0A8J6NXR7_9BACT|nr:insulinase family protein [Candidatus Desulfatibia profunda]MBL7180053.1 insulinase family protein [Desulfobacterales bacterium]